MIEKTILCFGDSQTWGWVPTRDVVPTTRYDRKVRWTGVLQHALGEGFVVVEEGLSGRTTNIDDPIDPRLNGATYLPSCLASHLPVDLVVVMVGTNDTKACFNRDASAIAVGVSRLISQIAGSAGGVGTSYPAPQVIVVAPPPLGLITNPWLAEIFKDAEAKMRQLPRLLSAVAQFHGAHFFDAGSVIQNVGVDGIHLTVENNHSLGLALSTEIKAALALMSGKGVPSDSP